MALVLVLTVSIILDCRRDLPVDLDEGVIRALSLQALGQVVVACNLLSPLKQLLSHPKTAVLPSLQL